MHDVAEQIRASRPDPGGLTPLDTASLRRRARRRDTISRAAGTVAVVSLFAGGAAVVDAVRPTVSGIDIVDPGESSYAGSEDRADSPDWERLDVSAAADQLIELSRGQSAPELPPPAGHVFRAHDIYVSQEPGQDHPWAVVESVLEADRQARGTRRSGTAELRGLDDDAERTDIVERVQQHRPELAETTLVGPDQQDQISWPEGDDEEPQLSDVRAELDSVGTMDPSLAAGLAVRPDVRIELLELLKAHADLVTYRGVVSDLAGRETVAFSLPLSRGFGGGTATLLFSPEDATPHGWEYHSDSNGWRMETLVAAEVVEATS